MAMDRFGTLMIIQRFMRNINIMFPRGFKWNYYTYYARRKMELYFDEKCAKMTRM
jgi:aspartate/tyrosine/aromatic aminotransferase